VRKQFWFLALIAGAIALPIALSAAKQPANAPKLPPSAQPASVALPAPLPSSTRALAAADVSPFGRRVPSDARLTVRYDVEIDRASIRVAIEPPAKGAIEWTEGRSFRFLPEGWREGRAYHVRVHGRAKTGEPLATADWRFRAGVPEPRSIKPGAGQPIVLTFDDAPKKRGQADRVLDLLREYQARAIFFPTGRWLKGRPDWLARAVREGHRVCNHTYSHRNLTDRITEAEIRSEIENGASDGHCRYFRPPLMAVDGRVQRIVKELGYELYFWDVDSRDWDDAPSLDVENFVLSRAEPGAVVLLHVHSRGTLLALRRILHRLKSAGYVLSHESARVPPKPRVGEGGTESHPE
jgi:peptidoglycan/xylan/chitin deacetylase (PgdA/CDA1 family)